MFTLVIGGSGSGKSEYAEQLIGHYSGKRIYIATMKPWDDECKMRIEKHRAQRRSLNFDTIECYQQLDKIVIPQNSNILLECMGNLVANELFSENGEIDAIIPAVENLLSKSKNLVIVTNEVFSGGMNYTDETIHYLKELAKINNKLAQISDVVVEIVCGMKNNLKESPN